uniref:Transmembrane protein 184C n=1 Tax=Trieres chinensis TaxID=1514140 RepID=A0A7S2ES59_TRICV
MNPCLIRSIAFAAVVATIAAAAAAAVAASLFGELRSLDHRLADAEAEVSELRKEMDHTVNNTIVNLNTTVAEEKETMQQRVQDVGDKVDKQGYLMAYQGAGTFVVLSVVTFVWHATAHLRSMHEPEVQRKILAILWMVPIYAVTAFLGLVLGGAVERYLIVVKDFYEAYCIYMFLSFLIAVLGKGHGEQRSAVVDILARRGGADGDGGRGRLRPPIDCCGLFFDEGKYSGDPHGRADAVLYQCQVCAMQFVFLRPVTSLGVALSEQFYGAESWAPPRLFFIFVTNVSIFVAFSGLLKFYHATKEDLLWCRPFPKFLCIKGVVFMTFWQGMVITILAETVYGVDDPVEWSRRAQNFLICLEMLFFAIAHCFVFPTEEWEEGYRPPEQGEGTNTKFGDNIALNDFAREVRFLLKSRKNRRVKIKGDSLYTDVDAAAPAATSGWEENMEVVGGAGQDESDNGMGSDGEDDNDRYIIIVDRKGQRDTHGNEHTSAIVLGPGGEQDSVPLDLNGLEECSKTLSSQSELAEII